jgi:hypothetical protein
MLQPVEMWSQMFQHSLPESLFIARFQQFYQPGV